MINMFKVEIKDTRTNVSCFSHAETSQIIVRANQLTGFYMIGALIVNNLFTRHFQHVALNISYYILM